MKPLVEAFENLFILKDGQHPKLLREFLGGRVSLETMIILDELVSYGTFKSDEWNKEIAIMLEEAAFFAGDQCTYIDPRQTEMIEIDWEK